MVRVRVIALETPHVPRHCPRCEATRRFVSSDRFRVNAQKKRLDVWLIYRCPACDFTWNREVVSRAPVRAFDPARLRAFHENDREAAWEAAFAHGAASAWQAQADGPFDGEVTIEMPHPCEARLDRVLANAFALSRQEIARRFGGAKALRRIVRDGETVALTPTVPAPRAEPPSASAPPGAAASRKAAARP